MNIIKSLTGRLYEMAHKHKRPGYQLIKFKGELYLKHLRLGILLKDHGKVSANVVTTEFCEDLVDNLIAEGAAFGDYKFHVSGTGSGAPAIGDTQATFTAPDGDPLDSGTQVEATSVIYRSVATIDYTGTKAVVEHGILNNATLASGILLDRSTFTVINVENLDSIEFTYELTCTAGG